ncbi:MAG TPA: hypothetical protein PLX41_05255 [Bacteroidales bacterium]|nr:hypothetical protein [Bacteroidales bacterium]
MDKEVLIEEYLNEAADLTKKIKKEEKLLFIISLLRLITFAGGLVIIYLSFDLSKYLGLAVIVFFTTFFLFLLKYHAFHSTNKVFLENLKLLNTNEATALKGDFSMFSEGNEFVEKDHDFTYDSDVFGPSSLYQYLCRTCTGYGSEVLAGWLSEPCSVASTLEERQEAIKELSGKDHWRKKFLATGMNNSLDHSHIERLARWLTEESTEKKSLYRKVLIWILPVCNLLSLGLVIAGLLNYSLFLFFFFLSLFIVGMDLRKISAIHEDLSGRFRFLGSLGNLLELINNEPFEAPLINSMKKGVLADEKSAVIALRELGGIIRAFDSRLNIIVGFVLNGLFLWDQHCKRRLEKWKKTYREQFPLWLDMVGQIDAFISLGNFSYNNRDYTFPFISADRKYLFRAVRSGHPLIKGENRVCNDFTLDRQGRICIVTGANMAGKSTFLRSVAINCILAMTGAPVCAEELEFLPVRLFTSMRTTDSLSSNESYFYAELKKLRILKEKLQKGENVFFLLDEILKGTNSEDKSQGSKIFIDKLIELGGSGLIATHDLSLGALEAKYPDRIINKCIEVEIDGEIIHFDYILRDGIASKKNAVLLMKQMGILD